MNSLQLWLAVVGGAVLAVVIAHGAWQTRKAGGAVRSDPDTVPFLPPREPSFDDPAPDAGRDPVQAASPDAATEPAVVEASGNAAPAEAERIDPVIHLPPRRAVHAPRVDALIDGIVSLALDAPVSGESLLMHLPSSRRAGGKPFVIEGREVDRGEWEPPAPGTWYGELQAGVQLASRHGPINEIEFSEFVQKIQAFADAVNATPDFPDMLDVVARGRELDAFANHHDAQLAMRLCARKAAWPVAVVIQQAARHGFMPGGTPGRLVLPSKEEGAPPMLALQFDANAAMADDPRDAQVTELTLMFDVPQTPADEQPFNAWCAAGQVLSIALDAQVFDDEGQPLPPAAFPLIREDLAQLYAKLAERDLAAGSPAARRLFS